MFYENKVKFAAVQRKFTMALNTYILLWHKKLNWLMYTVKKFMYVHTYDTCTYHVNILLFFFSPAVLSSLWKQLLLKVL